MDSTKIQCLIKKTENRISEQKYKKMYVEGISEAQTTDELESVLELLIHHGTDKQFASSKNRDILLKKSDLVSSSSCACSYFRCFTQFAKYNEESRLVVAKKQVHNVLTSLFFKHPEQLLVGNVAKCFLELISSITLADEAEEAFASVAMRNILVKIAPFMMSDEQGTESVFLVIANLTTSKFGNGRRIFATQNVRRQIFFTLAPTVALTKNSKGIGPNGLSSCKNYFIQSVANITDYLNLETEDEDPSRNSNNNNNNKRDGEKENDHGDDDGGQELMMTVTTTTKTTEQNNNKNPFPNKSFIKAILTDLEVISFDPEYTQHERDFTKNIQEIRLQLALKGVDKLITTSKKLVKKDNECQLLYGQVEYYQDQLERKLDDEVLEQGLKNSRKMMMMNSGKRRQRDDEPIDVDEDESD